MPARTRIRSGRTRSSTSSCKEQLDYYKTFLDHVVRTAGDVSQGEALPTRKIGPHYVASFTTEYKALISGTWGASRSQPLPTTSFAAGWVDEMSSDLEKAKVNPALADGLNYGPSRGHVQGQYAQLIGMPRGYGYGASMGVWVIDYVANWAGERALITPLEDPVPRPGADGRGDRPRRERSPTSRMTRRIPSPRSRRSTWR